MDSFTIEEEKKLKYILSKTKIGKNVKVLDIGCGSGRFMKFLKEKYGLKKIVGIDISEGMVSKAKNSKEKVLLANAINLPFFKDTFDFIFLFSVFPHILEKEKCLKEIFKILKKNGSFMILHLERREKINNFHKKIGGIVKKHKLPTKKEMIKMTKMAFFKECKILNSKNYYKVLGKKI